MFVSNSNSYETVQFYIVYMEKLLSEDEIAVVDKMSVNVVSGKESILKDLVIRVEHQ